MFKLIFFLTKVGPITALNKVPGNDPIEKHAKNTPAIPFSNNEKINNLHIKLLEIMENDETNATVFRLVFSTLKNFWSIKIDLTLILKIFN